jgi:hypothetical protein
MITCEKYPKNGVALPLAALLSTTACQIYMSIIRSALIVKRQH